MVDVFHMAFKMSNKFSSPHPCRDQPLQGGDQPRPYYGDEGSKWLVQRRGDGWWFQVSWRFEVSISTSIL